MVGKLLDKLRSKYTFKDVERHILKYSGHDIAAAYNNESAYHFQWFCAIYGHIYK